jgi:hypothetical protein
LEQLGTLEEDDEFEVSRRRPFLVLS